MVKIKLSIHGCAYHLPDQPCGLVCRPFDLLKQEYEKNSWSLNAVIMPNAP